MLTNKFVGIPIFAVVMFGVFYISQSTVGTWIADWLVGCIEVFSGLGCRFGGRSKSIPSGAFGGWHHWRRRRSSRFPASGNGDVFPDCYFWKTADIWLALLLVLDPYF